ncbi:hypothetical protein AB835_01915 [Candidatus Endobugula sertula]|uniref:DUF4156 domain-containing protein n=1 Tax=Candidatus Endobugula sertula TaxID=62101 RepID=A0A1D2QTG8_9GAMM|nr:hypothetical protein AB835_01915 [Candidatus Endobugula sertula]
MNHFTVRSLLIIAGSLLISACTWVELSEQAKTVKLVNSNEVVHCKKVGNISAKTRTKIIGNSNRSQKKTTQELTVLARNEAVKIDADRIVASSQPKNGEQTFKAYRCSE